MFKKTSILVLLLVASNYAQAVAVNYTDRTAFQTDVGSFLFENFDAFASGATVTSLFGGLVNITSPTPPTVFFGSYGVGPVQGGALLPEPVRAAPPLQIEFSTPVLAIGADLFDDFDGVNILGLRVKTDAGNTYDIFETSASFGQVGFLGILSLEGIVAAEFFDDGLNIIEVDNLTVAGLSEIPVPAAVWLFGTALIGLVGFGKRKQTA